MNDIRNIVELLSPKLGSNKKIKNVHLSDPLLIGFGSVVHKLTVMVENENGYEELLQLVAKKMLTTGFSTETSNAQISFKKEIAFYEVILPILREFLMEEGVKDRLDYFAEFYGARYNLCGSSGEVNEDGVILLEDMSVKGV